MSNAYAVALEVVREATQTYFHAADQYRAGVIDDTAYLAARAAYKAADAAFDVAFAAEENRDVAFDAVAT